MFESSREPASAAVRCRFATGTLRGGVSAAALGTALAAGLVLGPCPAWAGGGIGGAGVTAGAGGVDGSPSSATGGKSQGNLTSGGGGGGVDLTTGNGAAGGSGGLGASPGMAGVTGGTGQTDATAATITGTVSGGIGGAGAAGTSSASNPQAGGQGGGGVAVSASANVTVAAGGVVKGGAGHALSSTGNGSVDAGGGGGGGVGVFSSANVTIQSGGAATGGAGGGNSSSSAGGGGGGAAAIVLTSGGTVQNDGTLTGGAGGASTSVIGGGGGSGGAGVQLLAGGTVVNTGTITGGGGGAGHIAQGAGGAGIMGANINVINAGTITGGASGGGAALPGQAILFTGGVNSLEIQSGSNITGNVTAFSTADTFKLGGTTDASFDLSQIGLTAKYQGFGQYVKTGTATWTLTGTTTVVTAWDLTQGALKIDNDAELGAASGGLTFNGGALETSADMTTARGMTLTGDGTFDTDAGTTLTLTSAVTGAGALTKAGDGTLVLVANATYAGGTTITGGTLQLGTGGTTGSISGDVVDNGTLAFDRSGAVTFSGAVSGTGAVSQIGSSATTLTGVNTYTGGTTITGGTLTGSATSFGTGAIVDNAALVIDQPTDASFADAIDGTGEFTKTGAGNLTYTGAGTLTGQTTVAAGQLTVNGSLAASAVTVLSGAVLSGSGTVGATTIQAGGTVAPGGANTVLHVSGAFTQAAGSTYQAVLDPNSNASSRIAVTGAASLAAGAGLNVTKSEPGNFRLGVVYTVLSATGGLSGTYGLSGAVGISAFLALKDTYDANNAYLTVVQTANPASAAQTSNQTGVASGLPSGGDVTTAVLNSQSGSQARQGFDALSGDGHAATQGVLVNDSRLVRDLAIDRLQSLFCASATSDHSNQPNRADGACVEDNDHTAAWGQAFGAWGHTDGNGNAGNVSRSTGGLLMGIDRPLADWRLGGFLGYSHTGLTLDARTGSADIDSYHLGLYGGRRFGAWGFEFGGAYTDEEISSKRVVVLPDFFNRLSADYGGQTLQGFAQVDWRTSAGPVELEPFAGLAYVAVHTDHFVETGGEAALSAEGETTGQMFSTLGVRPSINLVIDQWQATLHGVLGWRHDFSQNTPTTNLRFVAGGDPFTVEGVPLTRDAAIGEVSLDMRASSAATVSLTYGVEGAGGDVDQTVRANFHVTF